MQDYVASEEEIQKLVSMGFERVKNSFCDSPYSNELTTV
jgi:hypothetical protein